jgi:hypothetical protein
MWKGGGLQMQKVGMMGETRENWGGGNIAWAMGQSITWDIVSLNYKKRFGINMIKLEPNLHNIT